MLRSIEATERGAGGRRSLPGGASSAAPSRSFDALGDDFLRPDAASCRGIPSGSSASAYPQRCRRPSSCAGLEGRRGARTVRRRRRPRDQPAQPADELVRRDGADLCLPRLRTGQSRGRLRRDHRRARVLLRGVRRPDRDGCRASRRWPSFRRPTWWCSTWRPRGVAEIAGDRLPRRVRARVSPLPSRSRGVQGRPRRRGWRAVDERGVRAAGTVHVAGRSRRSWPPSATSTGPHARAAVCPGRAAVPRRPEPRTRRTCIPCGRTRTSRPATTATPRGRSSRNWSASLPACASGSSRRRCARRRVRRHNPNYIGGDIITGANTPVQILIRPRLALDPYALRPGSTSARPRLRPVRECTG